VSLRIRKILVAIRDERRAPRSQLRKSASLARAMGASVELFHAINEPMALEAIRHGHTGRSTEQTMAEGAQRSQQRLERLRRADFFEGLDVQTSVTWDYPPHEAVVRRALAIRADLVIAATQPHRQAARLLLTNTDWELIRHCPCPLLLVKSSRDYRKPAVIGAVDPFHAHAKPARLDGRILDAAATLARALRGELHAFHAYMPLTVIAAVPLGQPLAISLPPEFEDVHAAQVASVVGRLASKAGIPARRRHLRMGDVQSELVSVVNRTRAGIVVMGAISRSGLRRMFIGNTAELVLDALPCDVLVVKPAHFKTTIPKRQNAWPQSR
jgi:universal stress protein E